MHGCNVYNNLKIIVNILLNYQHFMLHDRSIIKYQSIYTRSNINILHKLYSLEKIQELSSLYI